MLIMHIISEVMTDAVHEIFTPNRSSRILSTQITFCNDTKPKQFPLHECSGGFVELGQCDPRSHDLADFIQNLLDRMINITLSFGKSAGHRNGPRDIGSHAGILRAKIKQDEILLLKDTIIADIVEDAGRLSGSNDGLKGLLTSITNQNRGEFRFQLILLHPGAGRFENPVKGHATHRYRMSHELEFFRMLDHHHLTEDQVRILKRMIRKSLAETFCHAIIG